MGKSSSGKDTILKRLLSYEELNLKLIITYTTRPIRNNEVNGRDYYFIDDHQLNDLINQGKVIEIRRYNTVKGVWSYATVDDGQFDLSQPYNYILIGTLEAYKSLKEHFGANNVIPVYIECDDGVRLERALKRERKQKHPNYDELCRRFLADSKDFSPDKLISNGIHKIYYNDNLEKCIDYIKNDIRLC